MNTLTYILQLQDRMSGALTKVGASSTSATAKVDKLKGSVKELDKTKLNGVSGSFSSLMKSVTPIALITAGVLALRKAIGGSEQAYNAQTVAERKLEAVMKNTMGARRQEIDSILALTAAQQKLGVIGDEVQLSGAQELATYLTRKDSLEKLIPVMNDMLAQQYGLNASQEQAAQIAGMLGKVMDGQTGALSRYGYKFSQAQEKVLRFGTEVQRAAVLTDVVTSAVGGMNSALAATPEGRLKQQANNWGDMVERIGGVVVSIKAALSPVVEYLITLGNQVATFFDRNAAAIQSFVSVVAGALILVFKAIGTVVGWVYTVISTFYEGIRRGNFFFVTAAAVVTAAVTALAAYKVALLAVAAAHAVVIVMQKVLFAYEIIVYAVKNATSLWTAAQWLLNVALNANSVGLIIAGVVALIAVITFVIMKINGWGDAWQHTVNGCKLTFQGFGESVKFYWNTVINGLMIGLNKIKEGWYRFKIAMGLGDGSENRRMLEEIRADTEARKKAITDGAHNLIRTAKAAADEFKAAAGSLSWNDTSFSDVMGGITDKLGISAPGLPGMQNTRTDIGGGTGGGSGSADTATAIATGGSKTTHVTINMNDLIHTIHINRDSFRESAGQMRDIVLEELTRALTMAQGQI